MCIRDRIEDGVVQKITLEKVEEDLYAAALADPIEPGEHNIELKIESNGLSGKSDVSVKPKKADLTIAMGVLLILLVLILGISIYIFDTIAKARGKAGISDRVAPQIKDAKVRVSKLSEMLTLKTKRQKSIEEKKQKQIERFKRQIEEELFPKEEKAEIEVVKVKHLPSGARVEVLKPKKPIKKRGGIKGLRPFIVPRKKK